MKAPLVIGDRVKYKAAFLRSTGMYTGAIPFARGVIRNLVPFGRDGMLAEIDWDNANIPATVNVCNLTRIGSVELA